MSDREDRDRGSLPGRRDVVARLHRVFSVPGEGLADRIVHSGLWQMVERGATRVLIFVQLLVLARLLAPKEFGLFGIALLTQQTLDVLLQFGVDAALIQREERTEEYLNTAWTVKVVKATAVASGLLLVAPWVASFFDAPGAKPLIRVLALVVALRGLENIGAIYFRKELEFRKQFLLEFGSTLVNAAIAVVLAVALGSVWALMAGLAAGAVARVILTYSLHPYRPRLEFDREKFEDLWDYGKWLFGSSTLIYASTQVDDVLLGRWLGAASLGVYQVAYRVSNAVATEITHVISRVTFPALAKLQSAEDRLRKGFSATFSLVALFVVPVAGAIALFVPDLVQYVIGDQWRSAIRPVRILAAAGLIRALSACWGPLYQAQARTEKPFWKQGIRAFVTLAPAYPLTVRFGIEGMSLCVLAGISGAFAYDIFWAGAGGAVSLRPREIGRALLGPLVATAGTTAAVLLGREILGSGLFVFLALASLYALGYGAIVLMLESAGRSTGVGELMRLIDRLD